jgi:hypothetical protein
MSIELGGTDKNISYLNLQKSGKEASNDEGETCSVTLNFNTPWLAKQSDYLCAVTRFSVPLTQVPTIKGMEFEVMRQDVHPQNFTREYNVDGTPSTTRIPCRVGVDDQGAPANEFCVIKPGDHYTFHGFLEAIQHLLENTYIQAAYTNIDEGIVENANTVNFSVQPVDDVVIFNTYRAMPLSERIKMRITPDFRFQVMICNHGFADELVVKMSRGMFHMCQFQTSSTDPNNADTRHNNLVGHFFVGNPHVGFSQHQFVNATNNDGAVTNVENVISTSHANPVVFDDRVTSYMLNGAEVHLQIMPYPYTEQSNSVTGGMSLQRTLQRRWTVHTAHMCCADYNRCREIVFTSDIAVKSEGNSSSGYKRFLCDYQITDATTFSYTLKDDRETDPYTPGASHYLGRTANLTETLPSHRIYQSSNASAGRWQDLTMPSPLYEIEVRARVRCWDYETSTYSIEDIKLPAGTQYSVKLIFVSKKNYFDAQVSQTDRFHK